MFGTVMDTEGNSLTPDKFYVLSYFDDECTAPGSFSSYDGMRKFLTTTPVMVAHNCIRWDIPNLERVLEVEVPKETLLVDTLALSWYLYPKRPKHGLESWGEDFGIPKPEIDNWENLDYSVYKHRCETDVRINTKLWLQQYDYLLKLYGDHEKVVAFLKYLAFKMDCAREQETSRWKLDVERCQASLEKLEAIHKEKIDELRAAMPAVPVTETRNKPKHPFKKSGEPSIAGLKWMELCNARGLPHGETESIEEIVRYDEPNPDSPQQIKRWLFSLGWEPTTFKTNKKKQEVPQINKLKQDGAGVCESVKKLYPKEPRLEVLDNLFVVAHRIGILRGFLDNVSEDGYVVARVQGLTNTLRFKHAEVVNLPKIDAPYGEDVRGALIAPEGYELCGSDLSSLEDKLKQHSIYPYDPDYVNQMNVPGYDPHLDLALTAKKITKQHVEDYKNKVYEPWLKTLRGIWKNGNYSCQFGAFPPRIAKTVGCTLAEAQEIFDIYWKRNWAIKAVAQSLKTKKVNGDEWIYNPISTFWYSLRNEKDKFSTFIQGSGVYCFDTWLAFLRQKRPQLTAQFHDEHILCVKKGYRDQCEALIREALDETNELLNLNVKLGCDVQFGSRYSEIH